MLGTSVFPSFQKRQSRSLCSVIFCASLYSQFHDTLIKRLDSILKDQEPITVCSSALLLPAGELFFMLQSTSDLRCNERIGVIHQMRVIGYVVHNDAVSITQVHSTCLGSLDRDSKRQKQRKKKRKVEELKRRKRVGTKWFQQKLRGDKLQELERRKSETRLNRKQT